MTGTLGSRLRIRNENEATPAALSRQRGVLCFRHRQEKEKLRVKLARTNRFVLRGLCRFHCRQFCFVSEQCSRDILFISFVIVPHHPGHPRVRGAAITIQNGESQDDVESQWTVSSSICGIELVDPPSSRSPYTVHFSSHEV